MEPALRTLFLLPVIACFASGPAAPQAPFARHAGQPDYVVTMAWNSWGKSGQRTVTYHGKWKRIDQGGTSAYISASDAVRVGIDDNARSISFAHGRKPSRRRNDEPRNTGERQTYLDESCTVWNVSRPIDERSRHGVTHLSCITDHGIELWSKSVDGKGEVAGSAEATSIVRRPVSPEEVQPPRTLLALDWWDQNPPTSGAKSIPDHEVVMEFSDGTAGAEKAIRTTRRHGAWEYLDEKVNHFRRSVRITHDSRSFRLQYTHADGHPHEELRLARHEHAQSEASTLTPEQAKAIEPKDLERSETVLGETCRWFGIHMHDASHLICLTSDGILLKESLSGRSRTDERSWTAIRLSRRPISLDEIKPPAELLDPQRWGIE